jgi:RND family efflux transporter MFP subunit
LNRFPLKTVLSLLIGVGLLGAAYAAVQLMAKFRPEAVVIEKPKLLTTVETLVAQSSQVTIQIPSQGVVESARSTSLAAEVVGRIIETSPRFEVGERFAEGEIILRIDDSDYQSALIQAEASLAEARSALVTEQARAEQSARDWKKLGTDQPPSDLVLRKPQLDSAKARVSAATGALEKAKRDLERTRITAPFAGRLSTKRTELGSFVSPGSVLAEFTSVGRHRIRLPIQVEDLIFLPKIQQEVPIPVTLKAEASGRQYEWQGTVLRSEGEVERASRSIFLVADAAEKDPSDLLQPGLFVTAKIQGQTLDKVFRIPRAAFLDQDRLLLVDAQNRLRFRKVEVIRPDGLDLLVAAGLENGDRICLTTLAAPVEGMEVRTLGSQPNPTAP